MKGSIHSIHPMLTMESKQKRTYNTKRWPKCRHQDTTTTYLGPWVPVHSPNRVTEKKGAASEDGARKRTPLILDECIKQNTRMQNNGRVTEVKTCCARKDKVSYCSTKMHASQSQPKAAPKYAPPCGDRKGK